MTASKIFTQGNVLVTGCCGFIGSHLSEKLCQLEYKVVGIDWMNGFEERKQKSFEILSKYPNFRHINGDITSSLPEESYDFVFHLAAIPGVRGSIDLPKNTMTSNVVGTVNLFDWARKGGSKKVIYASSSSVYGLNEKIPFEEIDTLNKVNSPYAASKLATEVIASTYSRLFPIRSIGLRFFTVYGPRGREDMAIYKFLSSVSKGEEITIFGDGSSSRDYTYVEDIVDGILSTIRYSTEDMRAHDHEIFNLGNNNPVLLNELIQSIGRTVGKEPIIRYIPDQLGDVPTTFADITKAMNLLNYRPKTNLSEGLIKTWKSMSKQ